MIEYLRMIGREKEGVVTVTSTGFVPYDDDYPDSHSFKRPLF